MLGWVIWPIFCSSVIPPTIRRISASSAAASRAEGFLGWAVGQRDAAGDAPDECASSPSTPAARGQVFIARCCMKRVELAIAAMGEAPP
jgi:hypothetical protein